MAGVVFNFWEAFGALAAGGSAVIMLGLSVHDRFKRSIINDTKTDGTLGAQKERVERIEKDAASAAKEAKSFREDFSAFRGKTEEAHRQFEKTLSRIERGLDQVRAQMRLDSAIHADETIEIHRKAK